MMVKEKLGSLLSVGSKRFFLTQTASPLPCSLPSSHRYTCLHLDKNISFPSRQLNQYRKDPGRGDSRLQIEEFSRSPSACFD